MFRPHGYGRRRRRGVKKNVRLCSYVLGSIWCFRMGNRTNCNVRGQSMGTLINGWTALLQYNILVASSEYIHSAGTIYNINVYGVYKTCLSVYIANERDKNVFEIMFASADSVHSHWCSGRKTSVRINRRRHWLRYTSLGIRVQRWNRLCSGRAEPWLARVLRPRLF